MQVILDNGHPNKFNTYSIQPTNETVMIKFGTAPSSTLIFKEISIKDQPVVNFT